MSLVETEMAASRAHRFSWIRRANEYDSANQRMVTTQHTEDVQIQDQESAQETVEDQPKADNTNQSDTDHGTPILVHIKHRKSRECAAYSDNESVQDLFRGDCIEERTVKYNTDMRYIHLMLAAKNARRSFKYARLSLKELVKQGLIEIYRSAQGTWSIEQPRPERNLDGSSRHVRSDAE
ncbi:hypothetical protein CANCADRAFT_76097 [Tortispora caseinolytica NRRL Y-17796]|uniref:Uncharacterized protein n=1 Tax=Tortispora caseinolytica NRRL Y-17796 TaxID=767744 RepID=A0A1E4TJB6_9ASCO|nr:hypothetical protein CANCADRAFT_76097 [Tortispora caseinolytica NRRL Y-17796]